MRSSGLTDIGLVRKVNEDSFYCEDIYEDKGILFCIVADGMGGHNAGEVASSMAIAEIKSYIKNKIDEFDDNKENIFSILRSSILTANEKIYKKAILNSEFLGMGTTLSMALIKGNMLYIGHVGDSRVYLIRDRSITRLTEDHSLVAELVKNGSIKPEEAADHPNKNIITRAVGTEYLLEVDLYSFELKNGDYILLCTDGLSNLLTDEQILETILNESDIDEACRVLINKSKSIGGYDNITAVIIEVSEGGEHGDR